MVQRKDYLPYRFSKAELQGIVTTKTKWRLTFAYTVSQTVDTLHACLKFHRIQKNILSKFFKIVKFLVKSKKTTELFVGYHFLFPIPGVEAGPP